MKLRSASWISQVRITASGANSPFSGARDEFHLATYPPQNMK